MHQSYVILYVQTQVQKITQHFYVQTHGQKITQHSLILLNHYSAHFVPSLFQYVTFDVEYVNS